MYTILSWIAALNPATGASESKLPFILAGVGLVLLVAIIFLSTKKKTPPTDSELPPEVPAPEENAPKTDVPASDDTTPPQG